MPAFRLNSKFDAFLQPWRTSKLLRGRYRINVFIISMILPFLKIQTKDGREVPSYAECNSSDRTHGFLESMWPAGAEDIEKLNLFHW